MIIHPKIVDIVQFVEIKSALDKINGICPGCNKKMKYKKVGAWAGLYCTSDLEHCPISMTIKNQRAYSDSTGSIAEDSLCTIDIRLRTTTHYIGVWFDYLDKMIIICPLAEPMISNKTAGIVELPLTNIDFSKPDELLQRVKMWMTFS